MISPLERSVYLGNKLQGDRLVSASGVWREFENAKQNNLLLIPVGATGYVAKELWQEIIDNFESYYPNHAELKSLFTALGDESDDARLIDTVIESLTRQGRKSWHEECSSVSTTRTS